MKDDLEAVIATAELGHRVPRAPDYAAESGILASLAQGMARSPELILQALAQAALTSCRAGSAGISLIEEDGRHFRWRALKGELAPHLGDTTPREFSPCGTVVDRNSLQLFSRLERHFKYFSAMKPTIVEALLVPLSFEATPVGTIWVMTHDERRWFDAEDARLVGNLGRFAAAAYQLRSALADAESAGRQRYQPAAAPTPPKAENGKLRVLVVDDHRDTADALAWVLHNIGHEVRAAYDGASAIRAFEELAPHVIFQDLLLPRTSGAEIARQIRKRSASGRALLVAITGAANAATLRPAEREAFDHLIVKPVGLNEINQVLGKALSRLGGMGAA